MFYGLLNLSFWGYVIYTLILTHITIASVTIYLHRHQAHRALELHPALSHFFRLWLWLTTGMDTRAWASIHRKHHAKCETKDDPHSPQIVGLKKVLWEGAELYRAEAKNEETLKRYGHGTPNDWLERNVYRRYSSKGFLIMLAIDLILLGVPGLTVWAIQMMWIPFLAAGVINGVGHYWGYRNFECPDAARNISPWGILIGGEELHNNHHTFPTSAKLSFKPWEFDIGWLYIKVFSALGLAKPRQLPAAFTLQANAYPEKDKLKVFVRNRFQIMAHYAHEVIKPVVREECQKKGNASLLNRAKKLLIREQSLIDPSSSQLLNQVLANRERLALVYQYRMKLQEIWTRTTASQKELKEAILEWCRQAENTGIEALKEFGNNLRTFIIGGPAISVPAAS
ncbi:MAG: fatty acid desaturase [Gammaproteobacteria bacterium]